MRKHLASLPDRRSAAWLWLACAIFLTGYFAADTGLVKAIGAGTAGAGTSGRCPALAPPTGYLVQVSTVSGLQNAVANLVSGTTILIADGDYPLEQTLIIQGGVTNVAIRSASGNREAVVVRGKGMTNANYGNVPHGILIRDATGVLVADLTLRDAYFHNIQVQGEQGAQDLRFYNLRLIDSGEQHIKGSTAGPPGPYADNGTVECSLIEYTDRAPSWYTNGVDVLAGADWVIRNNVFRNIRAPVGQLAGPAILMWRNSLDTVVEGNLFIECDRGIALGLSAPDSNSRDGEGTYDHQGGVIRNNIFFREGSGDIGITVNYAKDVKIYHNTVILNGTFPWGAIEYRFLATTADIRYNLSDAPIWERDNASANLVGNLVNAQAGWFADMANGNLHLSAGAVAAIDQALPLPEVALDFDGELRSTGGNPDVGADEIGVYPWQVFLPIGRRQP